MPARSWRSWTPHWKRWPPEYVARAGDRPDAPEAGMLEAHAGVARDPEFRERLHRGGHRRPDDGGRGDRGRRGVLHGDAARQRERPAAGARAGRARRVPPDPAGGVRRRRGPRRGGPRGAVDLRRDHADARPVPLDGPAPAAGARAGWTAAPPRTPSSSRGRSGFPRWLACRAWTPRPSRAARPWWTPNLGVLFTSVSLAVDRVLPAGTPAPRRAGRHGLARFAAAPARTSDGVRLEVAANVGVGRRGRGGIRGGGRGHRPLPHGDAVPGPGRAARRGRTGRALPPRGRRGGRAAGHHPDARRRRRQAAPVPAAAAGGQPVPRATAPSACTPSSNRCSGSRSAPSSAHLLRGLCR